MWLGIVISVVGAIFVGYMPEEGAYTFFLPGLFCACLAAFCWGSEVVLSYYGMTDMDPDVAITLRECISGGGTDVRCSYYWQSFYAEGNYRNSIWD